MTPSTTNIQFNETHVDNVFATLTSVDIELKRHFDKYMFEEYKGDLTERLSYLDIAEISRFIVHQTKVGRTDFFQDFFNHVELILSSCDSYIEDLIVVGLFEGIQNIGGKDINYYKGFDQWMQPLSKQKWDGLIDGWEGHDWRSKSNSSKEP